MYMEAVPPPLDWDVVSNGVCRFLDHTLDESGAAGFVLGLSGGIDSTLVAYLAAKSRGHITGILMPDAAVTPSSETNDGLLVAKTLGISHTTISLDNIMRSYTTTLEGDSLQDRESTKTAQSTNMRALGNLRARTRATILYHYANSNNLLVLGSTDRSEYLLGYYTKFGDGAADVTPIISLYKIQVRAMARHIGIPLDIVQKKSSPHLWPGHDAEDEIGAPYEVIDQILYRYYEMALRPEECARQASVPIQTARHILETARKNHHKSERPMRPPLQ